MEILAAVVRKAGGPFFQETLRLAEPRADEVLVKIVATGICHSDISVMRAFFPPAPPVVLGHEGAGIVECVGTAVTHVVPGDHVVLSFNSCGACDSCTSGHIAYCENFFACNLHGRRTDGSSTLEGPHGPVGGYYFGQSSFATYALANKRNTVKVSKDAPLELLGPLGCGIQTGAGAVLNVMKPKRDSFFAVFGCGGVGLAALMGAKIAGCNPIVAVDKVPHRLELAIKLGATRTINAGREDPVEIITGLGGAQYVVEATGVPAVIEQATQVMRSRGVCAVLGGPPPEATVTLNALRTFSGHTLMGIIEGDADPHVFIPFLVEKFMAGELPIDVLSKFYRFEDINQAVLDSESGQTIKPILRMAA
jgi:aryl-alcohol dehydrogenase